MESFLGLGISLDLVSAIDYVALLGVSVSGEKTLADDLHIAVDEQQPRIFGFPSQEIANGSPASVLFSLDVSAMLQAVDDTVGFYGG